MQYRLPWITKESYKLATKPLALNLINRDRLFFDRFQYCVRVNLNEASVLRGLHGHDIIDRNIEIRRVWRALGNRINCEITEATVKNLHRVHDHFFSATSEPFKMAVSGHQMWVYSNSLIFLNSFTTLPGVCLPRYSEAVIDRPVDTVLLKNSRYSHRTYLKEQAITADQRQRLCDFFKNYHDSIRLSPSLDKWIRYGSGRRIFGYYFVDHDDDGWLVLFNLLQPGVTRKTIEIIADK